MSARVSVPRDLLERLALCAKLYVRMCPMGPCPTCRVPHFDAATADELLAERRKATRARRGGSK